MGGIEGSSDIMTGGGPTPENSVGDIVLSLDTGIGGVVSVSVGGGVVSVSSVVGISSVERMASGSGPISIQVIEHVHIHT